MAAVFLGSRAEKGGSGGMGPGYDIRFGSVIIFVALIDA